MVFGKSYGKRVHIVIPCSWLTSTKTAASYKSVQVRYAIKIVTKCCRNYYVLVKLYHRFFVFFSTLFLITTVQYGE